MSGLIAGLEIGPHQAVVRLDGDLRLGTLPELHRGLRKLLIEPGWVLADLAGLRLQWRDAVRAFPTALTEAGGWPVARLVLFGADPAMHAALAAFRVTRTVPLVPDRAAAERQLLLRPPRVHRRLPLPPAPAAARTAREFLRETCIAWDAEAFYPDAALVVGELVANAVEHTPETGRLGLHLDERGLWIEVRDFGPAPPQRAPSAGGARHGLHLVARLTDTWGITDHPDGKTVWVLLRPRPGGAPYGAALR
jgi:anti-sigma regulatory factor (Ser/Thr protein kinase)